MKGYGTLLAVVASGRFIAFVARMNIVPFYAELMAYYGASYTGAGALYSAFFAGYSLALIPAGTAADRYSPLRLVGIGLAGLVFSGLAVVLAPSYVLALAARGVAGLAVAVLYTACLKLVAIGVPYAMRGKAVAVMEVCTGLGMFTSLTAFPFFNHWVGYRALLLTLPVLCGGALLLLPLARVGVAAPKAPAAPQAPGPALRAILNRDLFFLTATSLLGLFCINGILGWLPTHLTNGLGYARTGAGLVTGIILFWQIAGVYPVGVLSDRLGRRLPLVHAGSVLLLIGILALMASPRGLALYAAAAVMGIGMAAGVAPLTVLITEYFGPERAGLVAAITIAVSQAGSGLAGVLFGWVLDVTGNFQAVWVVTALLIAIRIGTTAMIRERTTMARPALRT